jgi:hypothetical protein
MATGQRCNQKWSRLAHSQSLKAFPCRLLPKRMLPLHFCSITYFFQTNGSISKMLLIRGQIGADLQLARIKLNVSRISFLKYLQY